MPAKKKTYKLPTYLAPREKNNKHKYQYIPKKIFQTGGSCEVTKGMYDAVHTWIDKNPDWEYHFFDNKACRDFIKEHFPKKVLDAYDTLIPGAYKADLWRYCVLYIHGGLYVDNKMELLASSLNDVIPENVEFWSFAYDASHPYIEVAILCAKPKHEFFRNVIELIIEHIEDGYYGYNSFCPTGPVAFGNAMNVTLGRDVNYVIEVGEYNIRGFRFIILPVSMLYGSEDQIINFEYKRYRQDILGRSDKSIESYYRFCWCFDGIYSNGKVKSKVKFKNNNSLTLTDDVKRLIKYSYKARKRTQSHKLVLMIIRKYGIRHMEILWPIFKLVIKYEFPVSVKIKSFFKKLKLM